MLLASLPLVYHRLYIPPAVDSCYLVLGVGGLGAVGFSQFSCFLFLVVSAHLATDRGLCPCSCPSSLCRLSLLVIHCGACGRGWFFFGGGCLDPALVLFRPLDLRVGLFQCLFSLSQVSYPCLSSYLCVGVSCPFPSYSHPPPQHGVLL